MGKLLFTALLCLLIAHSCFAQNNEINTTYFDSLLLKEKFDDFLSSWENLPGNIKIQKFSLEESLEYDKLAINLEAIIGAAPGRARELSLAFKESYLKAVISLRGEKAGNLYQKYLQEADKSHWKESLGYYYAAGYFASQYIRLEKQRLLTNYNAAKELYNNGKYDIVLSLIENYNNEDLPNPTLSSLKDSLTFLYKRLEVKTKEARTLSKISSSQDQVIRQLSISVVFGFADYKRINDQAIILHHRTYSDLNLVADSYKNFLTTYNFQIDYSINPAFSLGIRAVVEPVTKTEIIAPEENLTIKQQSYSAGIIFSYYLRTNPGLRPFIRLEGGITGVSRDKVELNPTGFWYEEYDSIGEVNKIYPKITIEIGTEFQFEANDLFYFGTGIYYSNHFGSPNIIPSYSYGAIISCGINL